MRAFFHLSDNVIDKKIKQLIENQNFATRKLTHDLIKELISDYAFHFTNGSLMKAHDMLESHTQHIRKKDAVMIAFFCGLLSMIVLVTIILLCLPESDTKIFDRDNALIKLFSVFYTYRFLLMLLFTLLSTGVVINILKKYKVNYLFIFELDPNYKITPIQLFRVSKLVLLTF